MEHHFDSVTVAEGSTFLPVSVKEHVLFHPRANWLLARWWEKGQNSREWEVLSVEDRTHPAGLCGADLATVQRLESSVKM